MPLLNAATSQLLVIDLQARLMPAIHEGAGVVANAGRVLSAARRLAVPVTFTEQNPRGLGATLRELAPIADEAVLSKKCFDAGRSGDLPDTGRDFVVLGCEAHVCVLQTVLGLSHRGHGVSVVADATGSRRAASRDAALMRMARHGVEVVTTEMVLFEWLGSAEHPAFREITALIK